MNRKTKIVLTTSLAVVVAVVALLWTFHNVRTASALAASQSPSQLTALPVAPSINYQGQLMGSSGSPVDDGVYTMTFSIYDVSTAGSALWTQTSAVTVTNGLFDVALGEIANPIGSAIFPGGPRWLGVQVDPDPEMTPRQLFHSVPYAITAESLRSGGATSDTSPNPLYTFTNNGLGPALVTHGDVHVEGDLTWATRTGRISIPAAAFEPSADTFNYHNSGSNLYTDYGANFFAPIYLPDGATVTKMTFYYYDDTASGDVTMSIYRYDLGTTMGYNMASVTSADGGYGDDYDDSISYSQVDCTANSYYLYASFGATGSDLKVMAVVVEYEYDEPY